MLITRTAALSALMLVCSAAIGGPNDPDLTVSIAETPNPVPAGATLNYVVTIHNTATFQRVCSKIDPVTHQRECEMVPLGKDATGVVLEVALPTGVGAPVFVQPIGGGFNCQASAPGVKCTGGFVAIDGSATIAFRISAPARRTASTITATATVDPANTIVERSDSNNAASVAASVNPLPVPAFLPDLFASVTPTAVTTTVLGPNAPVEFDFTISNIGTVDAQNVEILMQTSLQAFFLSLTTTNGFACFLPNGFYPRFGLSCVGGTIPANGTSHIKVKLSFKNTGPNTVSIFVDPNQAIAELTRTNNAAVSNVMVQ